jgi:hypothetical protein
MLTEEAGTGHYELIFAIEFHLAECELLTADLAAAESRLSMLARRAKTAQDIAAVTRLRLTLYTTLDRSDRGVEVCLEYLEKSGTSWSPHPTKDEVRNEYERIWRTRQPPDRTSRRFAFDEPIRRPWRLSMF